MADERTIGIRLLVGGIVVLVVSLAADAIGLGHSPGFGYRHVIGTAVGAIAAIVGALLMYRR
ncbi:MAG: hypothetical protein GTO24_01825 [candidate division Zixibacteria bacterium]|nr:hypothetical protein [candidate division Zixibacteria bacterium]